MKTLQNLKLFAREDFPILDKNFNKTEKLIYLDHAATTQKPKQVIKRINDYYLNSNANVHRGAHQLSTKATEEFENARLSIKNYIKAYSEKEVIFTRNATEAINIVAKSWGEKTCKKMMRFYYQLWNIIVI